MAINYGDRALAGDLGPADWVKMLLTYLVPYGVATYAVVGIVSIGDLVKGQLEDLGLEVGVLRDYARARV